MASRKQALGEAQLLEPFAARGLVSALVRLADTVERAPKPLGQRPAERGLARARGDRGG